MLVYGQTVRGAEKDLGKYGNPDSDPRGPWMSDNLVGLATRDRRPNLHYDLRVGRASGVQVEGWAVQCPTVVGPVPAVGDLVFACVSLEGGSGLCLGVIPAPLDGREVHPGCYACPPKGWRHDPVSMGRHIVENRVLWPRTAEGRPRKKRYLEELKSPYTGFSSFVGYTSDGTRDLAALFGAPPQMMFPKPLALLERLVDQRNPATPPLILDFFAGSGTTGHAVLNLNRADGKDRRFILVESGEHFDTVLLPRILKAMVAGGWREGRPVGGAAVPGVVEVVWLEG